MTQTGLRLAFAGTPELARHVLEALLDKKQHTVEVVLTQPDRPAGRGRKMRQSAVKLCALENNIPIHQPHKASGLKAEYLNHCDVMLVVAYGLLITPEILMTPKYGCINIHTSLLPRWRGAAPIQRAIEAGDQETGISIMQMDQGLDTGPILAQIPCPIDHQETGGQLHDRLAKISADNINILLSNIADNALNPMQQDNTKSTYANKITKQEAKIDWSKSAIEIHNMIRAFNPFPVAHTQINDINLRVWDAEVKASNDVLTPGTILNNKTGLDIMTGNDILSIKKLQPSGKKMMSVKDFLNGQPNFFINNLIAS